MISRKNPLLKMLCNQNSSKLGRKCRHTELFLLPFSHIKKEYNYSFCTTSFHTHNIWTKRKLKDHLTYPPQFKRQIVQEGCNDISQLNCNNTMMTDDDSVSTLFLEYFLYCRLSYCAKYLLFLDPCSSLWTKQFQNSQLQSWENRGLEKSHTIPKSYD